MTETLPYNEMLRIRNAVEGAQRRQRELSPDCLRERNMALEWFIMRLLKAMPAISKSEAIKLLGRKSVETLAVGKKDTSKNENAKISYPTDAIFERATGIKANELF